MDNHLNRTGKTSKHHLTSLGRYLLVKGEDGPKARRVQETCLREVENELSAPGSDFILASLLKFIRIFKV